MPGRKLMTTGSTHRDMVNAIKDQMREITHAQSGRASSSQPRARSGAIERMRPKLVRGTNNLHRGRR
jgi:hypothetical protein